MHHIHTGDWSGRAIGRGLLRASVGAARGIPRRSDRSTDGVADDRPRAASRTVDRSGDDRSTPERTTATRTDGILTADVRAADERAAAEEATGEESATGTDAADERSDDGRGPDDERPAGGREGEEPAGSGPVDLDVVFTILKNRRRRLVLEYLARHSETSLSDLAEYIAAVENDKPAAELSSQERKRVYVGLYQCHLPRMDETGAVEFDKNRGSVVAGPNIDQFNRYLERSDATGAPWSAYYLGVGVASLLGVGGALLLAESAAPLVFATSLVAFSTLAVVDHLRAGDRRPRRSG